MSTMTPTVSEETWNTARAVLDALRPSDRRGVSAIRCPLHTDSKPSLLVAERIGMIRCAAGCLNGRWVTPQRLFVEMGIPVAEAKDLVAKTLPTASARPGRNPGSKRPPQQDLALRRVLEFLEERQANRAKVFGYEIHPKAEEWAVSRGLRVDRIREWLLYIDDDDRRALLAHFPLRVLALAGLWGGAYGGWAITPDWGLLIICRDTAGVPIWAQAVGLTAQARLWAKYRNLLGVAPAPFGLDTVVGKRTVVVAEGMTDALAVLSSRRCPSKSGRLISRTSLGVIGVPGVTSWRPEWFTGIKAGAELIVGFDADAAGDAAAKRLMALLKRRGFYVRRWRPEGGDLNDILRAA
jgi:hypothetical protein